MTDRRRAKAAVQETARRRSKPAFPPLVGLGVVLAAALTAGAVVLAWPVASDPRPNLTPAAAAPNPGSATVASVPPVPLVHVVAGQPIVIGVFGDSLGDGLWAGLNQDLRDRHAYQVVRFSRPATGLARYDYVDVQAQTAAQLARRRIDIAVVMLGANDEQAILDGRRAYAFASPDWTAIYQRRIDDLVGLFRQQGAAVYWVGLPKMRRASYDQKAQLLSSIYQARARALGVPFIPTAPVTVDERGEYNDHLSEGGARPRLMRARDGIHMTMLGYLRIAAPVSSAIRADIARARAAYPAG